MNAKEILASIDQMQQPTLSQIEQLRSTPEETAEAVFERLEEAGQMLNQEDLFVEDYLQFPRLSDQIGVILLGEFRLPGTLQRLAEAFKKMGYESQLAASMNLDHAYTAAFYQLYEDDPDLLESWILDEDQFDFIRSCFFNVLARLAVEGRYTKGRMISLVQEIVREALAGKYFGMVLDNVVALYLNLLWPELIDSINQIKNNNLISPGDPCSMLIEMFDIVQRYSEELQMEDDPYAEAVIPVKPESITDDMLVITSEEAEAEVEKLEDNYFYLDQLRRQIDDSAGDPIDADFNIHMDPSKSEDEKKKRRKQNSKAKKKRADAKKARKKNRR